MGKSGCIARITTKPTKHWNLVTRSLFLNFLFEDEAKLKGEEEGKIKSSTIEAASRSGRYRSSLFFVHICSLHTCKPIRMCVIEVLQLGSTSTTCDFCLAYIEGIKCIEKFHHRHFLTPF